MHLVVVAELFADRDGLLGVDEDALGASHCHNPGVAVGIAAVVDKSRQPALHAAHGALHCSTDCSRSCCPLSGEL